ncbi:hypothetical protein T07_11754 [Trichinella nelsoni]|uniref:Uncharacterized protein n=1 Tax=Trichinella nelsoni TaxID=6336 RepID=A0A0V0SN69_9BILA|nr:hypothetical protein T07_11754 [Trichinella nelsoni]
MERKKIIHYLTRCYSSKNQIIHIQTIQITNFATCKIDYNLISNLFSSLPTLTESLFKVVEISIAYHSRASFVKFEIEKQKRKFSYDKNLRIGHILHCSTK